MQIKATIIMLDTTLIIIKVMIINTEIKQVMDMITINNNLHIIKIIKHL
jgi:hypothetical protein